MKHIVFLYLDGRLAYTGYALYALKRLREDGHRIKSWEALIQQIEATGYFGDYEADVAPVSAPLSQAA